MPRIGYTLEALRDMDARACPTDVRLVWRQDDEWNMSIFDPTVGGIERDGAVRITKLPSFASAREMRLLGLQLIAFAEERERANSPDPHEVVP
jgi:hypothetical protein